MPAQVDFYGSHRNMTITVPFLDTVIRHRFVGHVNLGDNAMGILTFTHPDFQASAFFGWLLPAKLARFYVPRAHAWRF